MKVILVDKCKNCPYVKHISEDLWYCTIRTYQNHNIAVLVDQNNIPTNCPLLNLENIKKENNI